MPASPSIAIVDSHYKFYVHLFGADNRVDHCYLAGQNQRLSTLQVEAEGKPNRHRIDHNHFGPRPPLGRNGGETIRVGYSHQSMNNSGTIVEHNLFDRCDGEIEIISSKSCDNIYRYNTFLDCAGMLTLRHGNRYPSTATSSSASTSAAPAAIRVIGEDHTVDQQLHRRRDAGRLLDHLGHTQLASCGYFQSATA